MEDLGPGQVVGRQVLGSPCLGEIQLSIGLKRSTSLEVEIVRARNLTVRPLSKVYPGETFESSGCSRSAIFSEKNSH